MNTWNNYEDLEDVTKVRRFIEEQMEEYNSMPGVVRLDLIFFRDAIEHVCRILRVISEVNFYRASLIGKKEGANVDFFFFFLSEIQEEKKRL